jgi:hypothetical protein
MTQAYECDNVADCIMGSLTARSDQVVVPAKIAKLAGEVLAGLADTQMGTVEGQTVAMTTHQQQQLVLAVPRTPSFGEQLILTAVL